MNGKKAMLVISIILNVFLLGIFKYSNFIIGKNVFSFVPLGISFITFQQIAYLVDVYRDSTISYSYLDYATFVSFFPTISSGPIAYHHEVIPQLNKKENQVINWENITKGFTLFIIGLSKKVLLADVLALGVNWGYENIASLNATTAILIVLSFTFQIYFDFSGYSDMALGIGRMMNVELPINFNSPYKATTLDDFWGRWHMTLTRFFREYVYFPLGGNRKGKVRSYLNQFIVFLVSGIWHGPSFTYITWGVLNGIIIIINKMFSKKISKNHVVFNWIVTFVIINIFWVIFRAPSLTEGISLIKICIGGNYGIINPGFIKKVTGSEFIYLFDRLIKFNSRFGGFIKLHFVELSMIGMFVICINSRNSNEIIKQIQYRRSDITILALLFVYSLFSLSRVATFIYVNF